MFLTNSQIAVLAEVALTNYEVSCDWNSARRVISEDCFELYGFTPKKSLVLLALKMAKMGWGEIMLQTKNTIQEFKK